MPPIPTTIVLPAKWKLSLAWTMAVLGLVIAAEFVASEPRGWFVDFKNAYYPAGVAALDGGSLLELIRKGVAGFVNLPIVAYAFAPFALLPWQGAACVALVIGLAVSAAAYVILVQTVELTGMARTWLLLLFVFNGPLISSLKSGNTSQVALLAMASTLWLLRSTRLTGAGVILGLTAVLKLPLLLLGGFFLLRRERWRGAAAFAIVLLAAVALSLVVYGSALHAEWLEAAVRQFAGKTITAFNVQSAPALLARLRDPAPPLFDWSMLVLTPTEQVLTKVVQGAIGAVALWGLWLCHVAARQRALASEAEQLQLLLLLCLALLVSPLAWSHYYCWLLVPAAYVVGQKCGFGTSPAALYAGWIGIVLTTPLVVFPYRFTAILDPIYTKLAVSNYFLGGLSFLVALTLAARSLQSRPPVLASAHL